MPKNFAIHPGEILRTEFLEPLGLSVYRLAQAIEVPLPRINDVVKGKRSISADTALRLGIYFGLPAQFWLNLQNEYDLPMRGRLPLRRSNRIRRQPDHKRREKADRWIGLFLREYSQIRADRSVRT